MKPIPQRIGLLSVIPILATIIGCAVIDEPRLQGTWRSNREETVATKFQREPRWTNAPPDRIERFKKMFGRMTITYTNGIIKTRLGEEQGLLRYDVVDRGSDFVVVRIHGGLEDGQKIRIRFVDGGNGYWVKSYLDDGLDEKFDRVVAEPKTSK